MTTGLVCPHCAKDLRCIVLETRIQDEGVVRKRACGSCGNSFNTLEKVDVNVVMSRKRDDKRLTYKLRDKRVKKNDTSVFNVWK